MTEAAPELLMTMDHLDDRFPLEHLLSASSAKISAYAKDLESGDTVFVKVGDASKVNTAACLRQEAVVLGEASHPQLPKLLEANVGDNVPYPHVVEEFKAGTRMEYLMGYPNIRLLTRLCLSGLAPLSYLHDRQITHRDVKPENFLVEWSGAVVLVDPELAIRAKDEDDHCIRYETEEDKAGNTKIVALISGTPDYVPLERANGLRGTPASDVYAMGITMFALMTGQPPHFNDNPQKMAANLSRPVDVSKTRGKDIPDEILAVVEKSTQPNHTHRYQNGREMALDIYKYLHDTAQRHQRRELAEIMPLAA